MLARGTTWGCFAFTMPWRELFRQDDMARDADGRWRACDLPLPVVFSPESVSGNPQEGVTVLDTSDGVGLGDTGVTSDSVPQEKRLHSLMGTLDIYPLGPGQLPLPLVRFTVRRMMVAVAIVASAVWLVAPAVRILNDPGRQPG